MDNSRNVPLSDARSSHLPLNSEDAKHFPNVTKGAFHLVENSGLGVNGKRFSVHRSGKFPEKVELLKS